MRFLGAGILAFLLALAFDMAALLGWRHARPVVGGLSGILFLYALVGVALHPVRFPRPLWMIILGALLATIAMALFVFSLFIEIPARQTYAADAATPHLVTTGTYALCRHPGVLWLGLLLVGLTVATGSYLLLWATPVWWGLDICYAWIQDRFLFPRQFPGYPCYQRETPMLIPTPASVRRCLRTCGRSPQIGH